MFVELQQALVQRLESAMRADRTDPPADRVLPQAVRPYGGEMTNPKRLVNVTPIVFVEMDVGQMDAKDYAGSIASGEVALDVWCCTRNQAGGDAEYSDGVALLTWTFEQLLGFDEQIDTARVYWTRMAVGRMVSGKKIWAAKITPDIQVQPYA